MLACTDKFVCVHAMQHVFEFATLDKILNSDMQELCRVGQIFLYILFICMKYCPILYYKRV